MKPTYVFASRGEFEKCHVQGEIKNDLVENKINLTYPISRENLLNKVLIDLNNKTNKAI